MKTDTENKVPEYETISSLEDFSLLYENEEEQKKVAEFISSDKDLLESLGKIKMFDKEAYFTVIKSITDLIANGLFDKESLESIVESFNFTEKSIRDGGVAEWNNFNIYLDRKLFSRNKNGNFIYSISHDINHEIGHSIIELNHKEAITLPDELFSLLEQIDIKTESEHIQENIANSVEDDILEKERLAELFGYFLSSNMNKERFCLNRFLAIPDKGIRDLFKIDQQTTYSELLIECKTNTALQDLVQKTERLFDMLAENWPYIKNQLSAVDLDEINDLQIEMEIPIEQVEIDEQVPEPVAPQEIAPDATETNTTHADKNTHVAKETKSLGKKPERKEGFISFIGQMLASFSEQTIDLTK